MAVMNTLDAPGDPGAGAAAVQRWLERVTEDPGPFTVAPLGGGNSNDTALVTGAHGRRLLRRPPPAAIDPSAHALDREYRILVALMDTHVPVPRPLAVTGDHRDRVGPAILMQFIDGVSIADALPPGYPADAAGSVGEQALDALADLHSLPWRELGLEDFGRPGDFLARQVPRWRKQYERYRHRDLPDLDRVANWLTENRPADVEPGILHGDFHVDNCLFSRDVPATLLAVIDWEMSTIGDPLLDVGLMLAFWGSDRRRPLAMPRVQGFSRAPGTPARDDLRRRYERRSGRSLEHLDFYMVLAFWKLAAIVEAAHLQFANGQLHSEYARGLEQDVPRLLAEAAWFAGLD
jgi:aminoglycoside phosphotransferase (APT) family kinase protein